ncbi:MAG: hypothetical protein K5891_07345 [Lachnospiraceae bacterium]|nr:hypothetical protein [Lachnospiraceae bacterium]
MIRYSNFNPSLFFGGGSSGLNNSLYNNLSQLSSIRSGAYAKALKAYYEKNKPEDTAKKNTAGRQSSYLYTANSELTKVSKESAELVAASKKLSDAGKENLFNSKDTYDPDAALKAVKAFVSGYNETLDAVGETTNANVRRSADSMIRMTGIMTKSLGSIGVTVEKSGKLSVNEDVFKNADFDKVKNVLGTNGSFARIIGSSAQRLESTAEQQNRQQAYSTGLYGRNGIGYGYYGSTGSGFDGWF